MLEFRVFSPHCWQSSFHFSFPLWSPCTASCLCYGLAHQLWDRGGGGSAHPCTCAWAHPSPGTHPPSQRINTAQMLYPHFFGSKPAKSLVLWGGRHAGQGLRIPRGQVKESCFHPSLTHICFLRGWGQPAREQSPLSLAPHPKCLLIFSLSLQKAPPDRQESLVPLVKVEGKRYILGRQGRACPSSSPRGIKFITESRKCYRTLSAPHTPN